MSINNVYKQAVYQTGNTSFNILVSQTGDSYAQVTAAGYLAGQMALGLQINPGDLVYVNNYGYFEPAINKTTGVVTLVRPVGFISVVPVSLTATGLASSGQILIQPGFSASTYNLAAGMQWQVRDIRVLYAAAGLSGGSGNRLVQITDGATVFNSTGITAALLGTPVNTLFGGSGNPVAGSVAQNTSSAAGANIYAVAAGGTGDYTTGSVPIEVQLLRVA